MEVKKKYKKKRYPAREAARRRVFRQMAKLGLTKMKCNENIGTGLLDTRYVYEDCVANAETQMRELAMEVLQQAFKDAFLVPLKPKVKIKNKSALVYSNRNKVNTKNDAIAFLTGGTESHKQILQDWCEIVGIHPDKVKEHYYRRRYKIRAELAPFKFRHKVKY